MTTCLRIGLGAEHYAIDVLHVREVAAFPDVTPVPGAGPHVMGVCSLRGEILPVVRLDELLATRTPDAPRIVVVEESDRRAGLAISTAAAVEDLPAADASVDADAALTSGAVLHDGRLVGVLDVPALLDAIARSAS